MPEVIRITITHHKRGRQKLSTFELLAQPASATFAPLRLCVKYCAIENVIFAR